MIHSRAASRETAAALAPFRGTVVLHCFSEPELLEPALERGYYVSFAGNVTYPKAAELREPPPSSRRIGSSPRPTARTSRRSRSAADRTSRCTSATRSSTLADARGVGVDALEAQIDENATRAFGLRPVSRVAPKKALGQHFLVDRNVLGVIERLAGLEPDDVVLEIGPGLGVLTTFLADRVRARPRRRARPEARGAAARRRSASDGTSTLAFGDALALDLAALDPPPRKLVANLPYNVATPLVAETLTGVPTSSSPGA